MPKVWNKRDPKCPKDAVYVGRPTIWGNPYSHLPGKAVIEVASRDGAIAAYTDWIYGEDQKWLRKRAKKDLKGKDLVCWCAPAACHAEVLLELANSDEINP